MDSFIYLILLKFWIRLLYFHSVSNVSLNINVIAYFIFEVESNSFLRRKTRGFEILWPIKFRCKLRFSGIQMLPSQSYFHNRLPMPLILGTPWAQIKPTENPGGILNQERCMCVNGTVCHL